MQSLGGRLQEVVPYKSLDHIGSKFIGKTYPMFYMIVLFMWKVNLEKKMVLHIEKLLSLALPMNVKSRSHARVTLSNVTYFVKNIILLSNFHSVICKEVTYRRLGTKKIKVLVLKVVVHLWQVFAYKRFQM